MKKAIRKLIWRIIGEPPTPPTQPSWRIPINTMDDRRHVVDLALHNINIGTRFESEEECPESESLRGDYMEFGVFQGAMFFHVVNRAKEMMPWMRFFACDSFEGLPEIKGIDVGGEFEQGQFACSKDDFESRLAKNVRDTKNVELIPGWFDKSLSDECKKSRNLKAVSIAYIDCDLYESCVPVLAFLTDLLRQGSIVLFDDWFQFRAKEDKGVKRATTEWLEQNPRFDLIPWMPFCHHGMSFIVNKKSSA